VTSTGMTSGMLAKLLDAIPPRGLPSLHRVLYGGAALDPGQLRRAIDVLGSVLVQVYGRLEGGWPLTILSQEDHAAIAKQGGERSRSCGRAVGGDVELRLRSNGELRTRSPMTVAEYCDPDGWCGLGDLAHIDSAGYVYLSGRTDTMINTGYHVYPEEIEEALHDLPGVAAARVVGQPDERRGEVLAAYVVAEPGSNISAADVTAALRARLAAYKIPRVIKIVDAHEVHDSH